MNINFIGKEFEKLAVLEDCINYEYEPKSNLKFGKRNIYFDDIKLDFINEVNTYGFSPFMLESFVQQRDNPNIMRFITKKFNHGLTNYIKVQTKGILLQSNKNKKKLYNNKSSKNLKNNNNLKKIKQKKENLISNIFLIKKNEDIKKNEENDNFLQKALGGVGGYKLNISTDDEKEKENKLKESKFTLENKSDKNGKILKNEKINNIDLLKKILINQENQNKIVSSKNKLTNLKLIPEINNFNYNDSKYGKLKSFLDRINKLSENKNFNNNHEKKVLTLSKNKNILGNKKIFSPIPKKNFRESLTTFRNRRLLRNNSFSPAKFGEKNKLKYKLKNKSKESFLLFDKARPYKYMAYRERNSNNNILNNFNSK